MANNARLKLNLAGFRELRKSAGPTAMLRAEAEKIRARCGDGYGMHESPSKNRARFTVFPETPAAIRDNAVNNTLVKAMTGGR